LDGVVHERRNEADYAHHRQQQTAVGAACQSVEVFPQGVHYSRPEQSSCENKDRRQYDNDVVAEACERFGGCQNTGSYQNYQQKEGNYVDRDLLARENDHCQDQKPQYYSNLHLYTTGRFAGRKKNATAKIR
jgi:hypothetical protein